MTAPMLATIQSQFEVLTIFLKGGAVDYSLRLEKKYAILQLPKSQKIQALLEKWSPSYMNRRHTNNEFFSQKEFSLEKELKNAFFDPSEKIKMDFEKAPYIIPQPKYRALVDDCEKSHKLFEDPFFPANIHSLTQDPNHEQFGEFANAKWLRPAELFGCSLEEIKVFDNIEASDIKQGKVGNCYFMSSLSAVTVYPHLLAQLFNIRKVNKYGIYSVNFFVLGAPKEIVIDDLFPCTIERKKKEGNVIVENAKPLFARAFGLEIWVMLIEKAWASLFGSYAAIDGLDPKLALEFLTGAPTTNFELENLTSANELYLLIKKGAKNKYIMSISTKEAFNVAGLAPKHAYSIISVIEKSGQSFLLIRNPWGQRDYNEQNEIYTELSDAENRRFLQVDWTKDDGLLYMKYEEVLKYFHLLTFCYYNEKNQLLSVQYGKPEAAFWKIELTEDQDISIRLHQHFERIVKSKDSQYKEVYISLILIGENEGSPFFMEGLSPGEYSYSLIPKYDKQDKKNMKNREKTFFLKKGVYFLRTLPEDKEFSSNYPYAVSIYGKKQTISLNNIPDPDFYEKMKKTLFAIHSKTAQMKPLNSSLYSTSIWLDSLSLMLLENKGAKSQNVKVNYIGTNMTTYHENENPTNTFSFNLLPGELNGFMLFIKSHRSNINGSYHFEFLANA